MRDIAYEHHTAVQDVREPIRQATECIDHYANLRALPRTPGGGSGSPMAPLDPPPPQAVLAVWFGAS